MKRDNKALYKVIDEKYIVDAVNKSAGLKIKVFETDIHANKHFSSVIVTDRKKLIIR